MCRNIKTLHNFDPPATSEEVRAAALQYVRKVSGSTKPSKANEAVFLRAVDDIAHLTAHLLEDLVTAAPPRDRESEAVELLAFLLGEHSSEDLAEQADVRAERRVGRGVGGAAHPPHSARSSRATRPCRSASRRGRGPSPPRTRGRAAAPR